MKETSNVNFVLQTILKNIVFRGILVGSVATYAVFFAS